MELRFDEKHTQFIGIRLTDELHGLLTRKAKEEKVSISELVRALIRELE